MSHCPELVHKLLSKTVTGKGKQDHHDWLVLELLSDFTFTIHFHVLEKEMAIHSSVLAWRLPGTEEPGGLPSMGSHRVGYDCSDLAAAAAVLRVKPIRIHFTSGTVARASLPGNAWQYWNRWCCYTVAKWCPTLWDPMDCSMLGFPALHYLREFAQTHVHRFGDAIQPSHPLSPSSAFSFDLS